MESTVTSIVASLAGAIVGGLLTMWGAIKAVERTSRDIEKAEIRKERINCLVALTGLRFAMPKEPGRPVEWQARLVYELNKIPTLWCDEDKTLNSLQRYLDDPSTDKFVALLRLLSGPTKLKLDNVRDADLVRYARPNSWDRP